MLDRSAADTLELADLGLTRRTERILERYGVTVAGLVTMTVEEALTFTGIGKSSVRNTADALRQHELALAPSPPKTELERRRAAEVRGAAMAERWLAGETLESIGRSAGLSRERVRQLIRLADPGASDRKWAERAR
jgi:hypothetical protein